MTTKLEKTGNGTDMNAKLIKKIQKAVAFTESEYSDGILPEDDGIPMQELPSFLGKDLGICVYGSSNDAGPCYSVALIAICGRDEEGFPEDGHVLWTIDTPDNHRNSLHAAIQAVLMILESSRPNDIARWRKLRS